jgi:thiosulfate dehydrogenase (quinone) large subunit
MLNVFKREHLSGIEEPNFVKTLFNDVRFSVLWLVVRVWLGLQWITSGMGKVDNPAWVETGQALRGYWTNAIAIPEAGRPAIAFDWYRSFLTFLLNTESYTWFAKLVVYGEILIGVALIVGAFVGIAAFFGAFMNWNFMMAGSASTNPMLFVAALGLIFAWKIAGYLGADFFLLRWLGTPWNRQQRTESQRAREVSYSGASDD